MQVQEDLRPAKHYRGVQQRLKCAGCSDLADFCTSNGVWLGLKGARCR